MLSHRIARIQIIFCFIDYSYILMTELFVFNNLLDDILYTVLCYQRLSICQFYDSVGRRFERFYEIGVQDERLAIELRQSYHRCISS